MKNNKKYGLWTAIAMVVGIVIGSGIFFKTDDVLTAAGGNVWLAVLAFTIGALSMIFGAQVFGTLVQRTKVTSGIADYGESMVSHRFGYIMGWFCAVFYFPALGAVLAWVSGYYTSIIFNGDDTFIIIMAVVYMAVLFAINYFAPIIAGYFQVSTTIIKLIPLFFIGIAGVIFGLSNGMLVENLAGSSGAVIKGGGFAAAVLSTAFAYDGWILAVSINDELKDEKRNLMIALIGGTLLVFAVYLLYFFGMLGNVSEAEIISQGDGAVAQVASMLLGQTGGTVITVLVIISCLGTLNGLMMGSLRGFYALGVRGQGLAPDMMVKENPKNGMPTVSAILGTVLILFYLIIWTMNLNNTLPFGISIDVSLLPVALLYFMYIFIYVKFIIKMKDLGIYRRFIVPVLAIAGACIVFSGSMFLAGGISGLAFVAVITGAGLFFYRKPESLPEKEK
jgi:APA family basic amino acid/polyamine antiporter